MRALLSAYDRAGLVEFGSTLVDAGFELVGTGNTHKALSGAGIPAQQVSDVTGFPEVLDGRVKTLHPVIHSGILARRDQPGHLAELDEHGIAPIDVVACNLYPFIDTVRKAGTTLEDALENIDIGGPTMIRAAAKNYPHVIVVVDPGDYGWIGERLATGGTDAISEGDRRALALKAFQHVAVYDSAVSRYLAIGDGAFSKEVALGYDKLAELRYGENPHQRASVYADPLSHGGVVRAEQLHGPEMSFTNFLDADAAWRVVSDFAEPAATVVKHANPCGLALHADQPTAYRRAFEGDSTSAYGGIVGFNRTVAAATARAMRGVLYHIVVAPDYEPDALETLRKRKSLRVLKAAPTGGLLEELDVRMVSGGALVQTTDSIDEDASSWKAVTDRKPSDAELRDLAFAWKASRHIRSNTIVLAKGETLVGMGAGQPNRVTSVHLALRVAGEKANGSVLASDAYMPFADNVELAAEGGVVAVAQPGGSVRDEEVIEAADRLGIAMVFTGVRHFKH